MHEAFDCAIQIATCYIDDSCGEVNLCTSPKRHATDSSSNANNYYYIVTINFIDDQPLIPLTEIKIPPGYLLPRFKTVDKKAKLEDYDIFCFDSRSIKQMWEDCVKTHIRAHPETVAFTTSSR